MDSEGRTPLHYAAERGNEKIVDYLLEKGAKPSIQCNYQQTALHRAVWTGSFLFFQHLYVHGSGIGAGVD
jgi:ankyrin repeat protein